MEPRPRALALPFALGACFFLSGAGSLVLEVVWTRHLRLVFGTTTLAISTILVAYMSGLGIGGFAGGRLAGRVRDGVRAYGLIELAVGVYALAVPAIFAVFPALGGSWLAQLSFWPAALVRFALALAVLILPTIGMGMTLPFLTAAVVREREAAGRGVAILYGVNTLGAVTGVFLGTFALLPALGVRGASLAGAGIYLAVGAIALWLARRAPTADVLAPTPESVSAVPRAALARWNPALLAYGTVGFTSLVYEVAWTRALSMVMGSSIYAFACMLAAFLLGIALGSLAAQRWADRIGRPLVAYAVGIAVLGVLSLLALSLLPLLPAAYMALVRRFGASPLPFVLSQVSVAIAVMFPPALVLGALFPLLARTQADAEGAAPAVGDVYFVNTVGSAAGAFLAGFLFLPWLGLRGTAALAISLNLAAGAGLLLWRGSERPRQRLALGAAPAALALVIALFPPAFDAQKLALGGYVPARVFGDQPDSSMLEGVAPETLLYYRDGLSATVSVHEMNDQRTLHLNGKPDASTNLDTGTQVLLGHAGMLFGKPPRKVLVIGFASGMTVGSAARHPEVEEIDAVELEPAMIEASHFFEHVNSKPLADPRVKVILDDGRHYVETTPTRYDVIVSEPSNPWLTGVSNLFTREFFAAVRRALTPEGRLVAWFPLYAIDRDALRSILTELRAQFPNVYALVINRAVPDLMLLATMQPLEPGDLPRWESLPPAVQSDLYRIGTRSTADLWSLLRLMPADVAALAGEGARANSDDSLFVELRTPWLLYADHFGAAGTGPSAQAWQAIDATPPSTFALFEPAMTGPAGPSAGELAFAALAVRHDPAATDVWVARASPSAEAIAAAAQLRRARGELDEAGFAAELDRALALGPGSYEVRKLRARRRLADGDAAGALADIDAALAAQPRDPAALGVRASVLLTLGRYAEARADFAAVEQTEYWNWNEQLWYMAAIAELQDGDLADGTARLERYLARQPGLVQAWNALERAYTAQGRPADAIRARHNQAIDLYFLALSFEKAGDTASARERLQRALALMPEHAEAKAMLARLGG